MKTTLHKSLLLAIGILAAAGTSTVCAGNNLIHHNTLSKTAEIADADKNITVTVDYSHGCRITGLNVKGKNVLSDSGVHTGFRTRGGTFSSANSLHNVKVSNDEKKIIVDGIIFGDNSIRVNESWIFEPVGDKICWTIRREYSTLAKLEETVFPQWNFAGLSVWKGGIIDNGGMVWCKYLADRNDTYGVHTGGVTFWEPLSGDALRIEAKTDDGKFLASKYSHGEKDEFIFTQAVTDTEMEPRYNLDRFVRQKADIFAPFDVEKGTVTIYMELRYLDYHAEYSRGKLPGIDADAVRELMNTTGRYGVVDNRIVGANGWITSWKCLHEPFFAQIGMALNDAHYTANMSSSLDRERDYAMTNEGRVLSRWHNADEDQMPGTFNYKTGYYEAKWGYTMDSQTGYVINTAEQFDLCGDVAWLQSHKASCEKALDWLIGRDSNRNGIFEMMNGHIREQKASDWLDIVWAGFENAFVNAQMYEALNLWSGCERVLGDREKSAYYALVASRLKENFNRTVHDGGFWYPEKKQYVYWRDNDGVIHGDNLVTPVNFAAIAFGLCDDKERTAIILAEIERRTSKENLFHWPLCFDSFKEEEVHAGNWPFPRYENGDIFPTWGYLGVRAYAEYDRVTALKFIQNILKQYGKDGLSSQRYSRETQQGEGSDILAGICTSVTALYRDIYGIRPKWNRMGLEPRMLKKLDGTEFHYTLRNTVYQLRLSVDDYEMSTENFSVRSKEAFGASFDNHQLSFFPHNRDETVLRIAGKSDLPVSMSVIKWAQKDISWRITSTDEYTLTVEGLDPTAKYQLTVNGKATTLSVENNGTATFFCSCRKPASFAIKTK
ncbi:MAG: hypothetical protein LBJ57_05335 [Prevotellaceae bacterium]|jgi:hypothetical protein|nr:hypothetical protein [Prevotellaceae bacterium]